MTDSQKYSRIETSDPTEHLQPLNEESEVNYLPCYRFSSRSSFVLWRCIRLIWPEVLVIIAILMPIIGFSISANAGGILCAIDVLFIMFPITFSGIWLSHYNSFKYIEEKIPVGSEVMFYAEIIKYKPSSDPRTWTIIGNHMSKKFIEENQSYSLFNGQDYFDLFRHLTRSNNGSARRNNGFTVNITTSPSSNDSETNMIPGSILSLDEPNDVSVETASDKTDNEALNNNVNDVAPNNTVANGAPITSSTTTTQNIIPDPKEKLLRFLLKARSQAIQSFDESDERYWSTLYPDFAE